MGSDWRGAQAGASLRAMGAVLRLLARPKLTETAQAHGCSQYAHFCAGCVQAKTEKYWKQAHVMHVLLIAPTQAASFLSNELVSINMQLNSGHTLLSGQQVGWASMGLTWSRPECKGRAGESASELHGAL